MQITIKAEKPEDIREEIVFWLNRAAGAERSFGLVMHSKKHKERCDYAAEVIERLAQTISDMNIILEMAP